ncbi:hypothetical protein [Cellulomonas sp. NPDC089187]|uniref:hypothetical protein n=1 Tax=Cellulomonas sp. NPDC089187 TaxID=3154970 RepID=UPI0034227865
MSAKSVFTASWWSRRRAICGAAIVVILAVLATVLITRPVAASEQYGLQTINVRMGTDTSVQSMSTASVTKDAEGHISESTVDLDPTESVSDLPVRVQTSWWHDGSTGTDLAALDGKSGRFVVQVSVQDLTAEATELSYETNGARYRQQALVGVPLTVVASAEVGNGDRVVQVADGAADARTTNGVLVETTDTGRSVQWAAFLAPPMLSATADFTLVVDTQDFRTPAFDITVQPGLVTDPSVSALVDRAFGSDGYSAQLESSTISLVQNVNSNLAEALEFVDQVHETLEMDVAQLGEQTYRELESSSETVLSHLESTASELDSILSSAQSGITQVGSQTHSGVSALASSLNGILGSTALAPEMTATTIDACSVTMPTLADGQVRTVASTVYVADAQLQAIVDLFTEDAPTTNCRGALHELMRGTIGDPTALEDAAAMAQCQATAADQRTVACTLAIARTTLATDFQALAQKQGDVRDTFDQLAVSELTGVLAGSDGLAATLTDLRDRLVSAEADSTALSADLTTWAQQTGAVVTQAQTSVQTAQAELDALASAVGDLGSARDALYNALFADAGTIGGNLTAIVDAAEGTTSVGQWFVDSQYVANLSALVASYNTNGQVCASTWADSLGTDPSADAIVAALNQLDVPGCPAQGLAVASREMVTGYQETVDTVNAMGADASAASTALAGLQGGFADLDAAIADLTALTATTSTLHTELAALYDAGAGTGTLVDLSARVQSVADLVADGGDLAALDSELGALAELATAIWPDDTVQPLTEVTTCSAVQPSVGEQPTAAGQGVVWLSNRLLCLENGLGERLTQLESQIDTAAQSTNQQLLLTVDRTQGALDRAESEIDALSSSLVTNLTAQKEAATESSLTMIEESRAQMKAEMDEILAAYDLASSQVLQQLSDSMQRSAAQSTAVAEVLNQDFADLLANLGSPDPTSRGGMLGKLHSITTQVGETGTVLDSVGTTTTAYGNQRSGELRDIDLRAAQYAAAEERLAAYRPFAQVDDDLETVFVFQLRGEK